MSLTIPDGLKDGNRILIKRILTRPEVEEICKAHGLTAQPMEGDYYGEQ